MSSKHFETGAVDRVQGYKREVQIGVVQSLRINTVLLFFCFLRVFCHQPCRTDGNCCPRVATVPDRRQNTTMKRKRDANSMSPLLSWLDSFGSTHPYLSFRPSLKVGGGIGVFTTQAIKPGGVIANIPQQCVLSATKALRSEFGQACSLAIQDDPTGTDEFVMLLWMAIGRKDTTHSFHAYLQSLPQTPSLPISWPRSLTDSVSTLGGTNLGTALDQYRELVQVTYALLINVVRTKCPLLIPTTFQHDDIVWAHDNYLSRRFPEHLAVELEAMGGGVGGGGGGRGRGGLHVGKCHGGIFIFVRNPLHTSCRSSFAYNGRFVHVSIGKFSQYCVARVQFLDPLLQFLGIGQNTGFQCEQQTRQFFATRVQTFTTLCFGRFLLYLCRQCLQRIGGQSQIAMVRMFMGVGQIEDGDRPLGSALVVVVGVVCREMYVCNNVIPAVLERECTMVVGQSWEQLDSTRLRRVRVLGVVLVGVNGAQRQQFVRQPFIGGIGGVVAGELAKQFFAFVGELP